MKKTSTPTLLAILCAVILLGGCGLFDKKNACDDIACPQSDLIDIVYKSAADSTANLFDTGQFSLDQLSVSPILHDKNGPMPFILKAKLSPAQTATVQATAVENLRGLTLRLANFPPDTILLTTGLRPAETCCSETTTISQLLANGQPVPTIGSVIPVVFYH